MYSFHQWYVHVYLMFGFQYHTDYFFEYLFMNEPTGNFPKYYIFNNIIIYHFEDRILYSQTSPQQPLWGPKKVAVVKKWSLWGGGGVIWQFLLGENNMYIMPSLCLLYAIMEIQS